ncbi:hypothetical protein HCJ93_03460 [Streptomyces sp. SBST2-5]|mgnify:CR=1 FL=1|uniref:Type A2 lantipeptide n=1 Tax=Streptomyces composti TaxID=2720025 RepID=A0ABX1A1S8_9ACTN|nr:hypothetical protein [Streptomyces composti]NJP49155.1 hypothetical protein [Streptomyces composti]
MNLAPQVETAELTDADLESVSGGQAGAGTGLAVGVHAEPGALGVHVEAGPLALTAGAGVTASLQGVSADGHLSATLY